MIVPAFQKGLQLSAADLNSAMDCVRRARVLPGVGIKLTETVNGTVVSLKPQRLAGGAESTLLPWDAIDLVGEGTVDSAGNYSSYKCKIYPGLVSGAYPGNMLQEFTGLSGTLFLVADVTTDGWALLSVALSFATQQAAPVPSQFVNAPSSFKITIGLFVSGVYFNLWKRNISATVKEAGRQEQEATGPFELPYKSLWTWGIATA
jgi:hypothetical protein